MRRWGTAALVLVLAAGAIAWVAPWLTKDRSTPASVPSPRALERVETVPIPPRRSACVPYAAMDTRSARARLTMVTRGGPAPPLTLTLDGPGYRAERRVASGYGDNEDVSVAVPAPRRAVLVRVCVRNDGAKVVRLAASDDRTKSRSLAVVAGRRVDKSPWLAFDEARSHSVLDRLPATMQRMSTFRPGIVGPWLFWPLALLVLAGIPLGVVWAYSRTLAAEDVVEPRREGGAGEVGSHVPR
jgi:hypothetical protein